MALSSAAISDKPTGSHVIDWRARKNVSRLDCRREKYTPTAASARRYAITITASIGWSAVLMRLLVLQSLAHDVALGRARRGGARLARSRRGSVRRPAARSHDRGDRDRPRLPRAVVLASEVPPYTPRPR